MQKRDRQADRQEGKLQGSDRQTNEREIRLTVIRERSQKVEGEAKPPYIQGDSKRLLKVYVSISLIIFGPGDLKFCTEQLQNYTI